jgi:AraC-like DNA-binding protein
VFNEGGGDRPPSVKLVCGFLACDAQPFNPLFDKLPPMIKSGRVEGSYSSWPGEFIWVVMLEAGWAAPMHYLANWRMQIAAGFLSGGTTNIAIAAETGYGSEAAFSRAFKKSVGLPPAAWRRRKAA